MSATAILRNPQQHDTSPWIDLGANPYLDRLSTNSDVKRASSVHFPVNAFLLGPCSHKTFFEKLVNGPNWDGQPK
jgi:hypothetical protein